MAYTQSEVTTILDNLAYLESIFLNIAPQHPPRQEAVVLSSGVVSLKERLIPWVFVGSNVELGGEGVFFTQSCWFGNSFVVWSNARKRKKKNDLKWFCPGL